MKQKIFAALIALLALGTGAAAQSPYTKTIEPYGYQQYFSSVTMSAQSSSSFTISGPMLGWDARVIGGTAQFKVSFSTNSTNSGYYALIQSSTVFLASGDTVGDDTVRGNIINPIFFLSALDSGASFYIDISYLSRKDPQDPTGWGAQ